MIIQRISQSFQACLEAQGDFAHSTLVQRSQHVWMETINKRQIVRMRNLSAYLWDNVDKLQENAEMSSNGLCLQTNFDDLSNSEIPQMNCPRKAACRSQILADLEVRKGSWHHCKWVFMVLPLWRPYRPRLVTAC